ncbi:MAG: AAA family ATPase [Clostridium sp.]|nr:AAA family ATPase [Clostridium sp.]
MNCFFSTDNEKNVTVVLGDNTFGKTTLAQAFRWGLYESLNDTSYNKKKDVVLLNNEAAAELKSGVEKVFVEIVVINQEEEIRFMRTATFNRKNVLSSDISVKQIGPTELTMQLKDENGIWGDVIPNSGKEVKREVNGNVIKEKYVNGCVQDKIDNIFPQSLSNYFFFDGERWNDLKSKTSDIKKSIYTILGVSGLIEMMNHLKDGSYNNVEKSFRAKVKGVSGEYTRLKNEIQNLEKNIVSYEEQLKDTEKAIGTEERIVESTQKTLNDNRKVEDDQKEYKRLEEDILREEKYKNSYYADMVKIMSESSHFFTASLLEDFESLLEKVDLEGRDIPGVTVDTIDYLIEHEECLCGTKLDIGSKAYDHMVRLRKQVPPEMLGGAAGKLKATLENWRDSTQDYIANIEEKAELFDMAQDTIDEKNIDKDKLEKRMDRKTNLAPVRAQNRQAKTKLSSLRNKKAELENKIGNAKDTKKSKEKQFDALAIHDKNNAQIYKSLDYVEELYKQASIMVKHKKQGILEDLNEIIELNFQRMFNDKEKYARLGDDYKVHVFYKELNGIEDYEELHLSNGETIAINFVFIVSILELASKYRKDESENDEY